MSYQTVTPDAATWDAFVRAHPCGHLLQLSAWGQLKSEFGWRDLRVGVTDSDGQLCSGALVLLRRLPLGTIAYIPFGPLVDWTNAAQVQALFTAIDQTARQRGAILLKIEPGHDVDPQGLRMLGFRPSPQTVQPPSTIVLDLDDEDSILKRMNQMTRRNIRKSDKQMVQIREGSRADVDSFNAMLDETGSRQDFGVHVAAYYEHAFELFVPSGHAALLIGSYDGLDLAGVFVFKLGQQAWYLYGASRHAERQRMAAFGVQWAAIQWAFQHGCTTYDMYGIPDEDEATLEKTFQERSDDLWGVYRFKRGWGGRVVRSVGAWDQVYNRLLYGLYQLALRLRGA